LGRTVVLDSLDRALDSYSYVSASLGTRLLFKRKPNTSSTGKKGTFSAREIVSYTIKQDYYFDPATANRNRTIYDISPEFSQLINTLRIRPVKHFSIDSSIYYNHYLKRFTYILFSLGYRDRTSPVYGDFKYIRSINPFSYKSPEEIAAEIAEGNTVSTSSFWRESVGGSLNVDIPGFPFKFSSRLDWDVHNRKFLNRSFKLGFDYQCITLNAGLQVYNVIGKPQTRFSLGISVGNLGTVKSLLGGGNK
ncbi:MAG: LPS assembly protein LptD, partial [bacterium]|nr:LPS assembly protein LptD [bacterium]